MLPDPVAGEASFRATEELYQAGEGSLGEEIIPPGTKDPPRGARSPAEAHVLSGSTQGYKRFNMYSGGQLLETLGGGDNTYDKFMEEGYYDIDLDWWDSQYASKNKIFRGEVNTEMPGPTAFDLHRIMDNIKALTPYVTTWQLQAESGRREPSGGGRAAEPHRRQPVQAGSTGT